MTMYLIQSVKPNKRKGDVVVWYRAHSAGYTTLLSEAGRYSPERMRQIIDGDSDHFLRAYKVDDVERVVKVGLSWLNHGSAITHCENARDEVDDDPHGTRVPS